MGSVDENVKHDTIFLLADNYHARFCIDGRKEGTSILFNAIALSILTLIFESESTQEDKEQVFNQFMSQMADGYKINLKEKKS